jgi:hypothetical protein
MAQSNADMIQNGFEAIADGDIPALLELMDPDIEWHPPRQGTLDDTYSGHEGVTRLFKQLFEAWERIGHEPTKLVEAGDKAVIVTHVSLRARMSGLEIDELWAYYVEIRDGRFWRVWMYTDPEQALKEHSAAVLSTAPDWPGS